MKMNKGMTVSPYFARVSHSTELTMFNPALRDMT